jgi:biopolymer transport protein ExbB/TolQ
MNAGALLQSAIYLISVSMLYPAMFLLTAGFAVAVISSGAVAAEWAERSRLKKAGGSRGGGNMARESREIMRKLSDMLREPDIGWDDVEIFWREARLAVWKKLDYLRILARLGPAMGLVGTLIPMSTGLASLSQGDASRLSGDLVVAFSTTVVGLCSGVAAYILYIVRSRWAEGDLDRLRIAIESEAAKILDGKDVTDE